MILLVFVPHANAKGIFWNEKKSVHVSSLVERGKGLFNKSKTTNRHGDDFRRSDVSGTLGDGDDHQHRGSHNGCAQRASCGHLPGGWGALAPISAPWYLKNMEYNWPPIHHIYRPFLMVVHFSSSCIFGSRLKRCVPFGLGLITQTSGYQP